MDNNKNKDSKPESIFITSVEGPNGPIDIILNVYKDRMSMQYGGPSLDVDDDDE